MSHRSLPALVVNYGRIGLLWATGPYPVKVGVFLPAPTRPHATEFLLGPLLS